jgi:hypothetical protein
MRKIAVDPMPALRMNRECNKRCPFVSDLELVRNSRRMRYAQSKVTVPAIIIIIRLHNPSMFLKINTSGIRNSAGPIPKYP